MKKDTEELHQLLCAYLLGELEGAEAAQVAAELERSPELQAEKQRLEGTIHLLQGAFPADELSQSARQELVRAAEAHAAGHAGTQGSSASLFGGPKRGRLHFFASGHGLMRMAAAFALLLSGWALLNPGWKRPAVGPSSSTVAKSDKAYFDQYETPNETAGPSELGTAKSFGKRKGGALDDLLDGHVRDEVRRVEPLEEAVRASTAAEELKLMKGLEGRSRELGEKEADQGLFLGRTSTEQAPAGAPEALRQQVEALERSLASTAREQAESTATRFEGGKFMKETQVPSAIETNPPLVMFGAQPDTSGDFKGRTENVFSLTDPADAPVTDAPAQEGVTVLSVDQLDLFLSANAPQLQEPLAAGAEPLMRTMSLGGNDAGETTRGFYEDVDGKARGRVEVIEDLQAGELDEDAAGVSLRLLDLERKDAEEVAEETVLGAVLGVTGYSLEDARKNVDQDAFGVYGYKRRALDPDALAQVVLDTVSRQPGETPEAMFFRCWGDNAFVLTALDPFSTFAADVDTASYTLARRMLVGGHLPSKEQVRTEEFVNYFRADRPAPQDDVFALGFELAPSRFSVDPDAWMLRVTVRGQDVDVQDRQPLALTFVIDVSGSMEDGGRLELVKRSFQLLLGQLDGADSVSIVSFNREAQIVAPLTSAANRDVLEQGILALAPEGGTSIEAGLAQGFQIASDGLTPNAVNRVVLLSDGVGNIGETDQNRILAQVGTQREQGIYLNTIGVGLENFNDDFLEQLADRGDGLCHYVDSDEEAKRAFVGGLTKTFQPIARDVKLQVEFDESQVVRYRQIGYENRALTHVEFRDDAVDAGELNAGHQVTALYELQRAPMAANENAPIATLNLRYKLPFAIDFGDEGESGREAAEVATEISTTLLSRDAVPTFEAASLGYQRAVLVAQFAEFLRRSVHTRGGSYDELIREAGRIQPQLRDADFDEFLNLVTQAEPLLADFFANQDTPLDQARRELCEVHLEEGQLEQLDERRRQAQQGDDSVRAEGDLDGDDTGRAAELRERAEELETRIRELVHERYAVEDDER